MILHLKRYGYNTELLKNSKRVDSIRIPRSINIGKCSSLDSRDYKRGSGNCSSLTDSQDYKEWCNIIVAN